MTAALRAAASERNTADASPDLIAYRQPRFVEVANPHHYPALSRIADLVPDEVLRRTPAEVAAAHRADWKSLPAL